MQYSEKIEATRQSVIKAEFIKRQNESLFMQLMEVDDALKMADEILYHLPSDKKHAIKYIEQITYAIVKENYDANMRTKYNFTIPDKLNHKEKHDEDLFKELGEIATLEIGYYSKLNECYENELSLIIPKTL